MKISLKEIKEREGYASGYHFLKGTKFFEVPRYWFIWLFLNIGFNANMVTTTFGVLGIIGLFFIAMGNYWLVILGSGFMTFAVFLDEVDGAVARISKKTSNFGMYLDGVFHWIHFTFLWIALGIGIWNIQGEINYFYLGLITSSIWILNSETKNILYKSFFYTPEEIKKIITETKSNYEGRTFTDKIGKFGILKYNSFRVLKLNASLYILIALAIFGYEKYFLFFYSVMLPIFYIRTIYMIFEISRKIRRFKER